MSEFYWQPQFGRGGPHESAKKDIESNIAAYRSILSIVGGADEQRIEDIQKHFKLNVLTEKFRQRLEKRLFG
ncbi:MAG: hypothetical protein NTW67_06430 [Candidatus Woesearchaeota archaeon]|nr:hypothetical protein [Candidatus Woesearchaeota archaeon]